MSAGYVYILTNRSMKGLVKIGITRDSVQRRAQELNSTGVPTPFEIQYYRLTGDCEEVERALHSRFAACRAPGREFFRASLRDAILEADRLSRPVKPERYCSLTHSQLHPLSNALPQAGSLKLKQEALSLRGRKRYLAIVRQFAAAKRDAATIRISDVEDRELYTGLQEACKTAALDVDVVWPPGAMVRLVRTKPPAA